MSEQDSETPHSDLPPRGLLGELFVFARQHFLLVLLMVGGPTALLYALMKNPDLFTKSGPPAAAPWTSEKTEYDSLQAFVEYRLKNDPELERLRTLKPETKAELVTAAAPATFEAEVLIAGGHAVADPTAADPGLAAQIDAVLHDGTPRAAGAPRVIAERAFPGLAFHGLVDNLRFHRENPPRRSLVVEFSLATERASEGTLPETRKKDLEELAGLANGRFFPVVAVFPALDKPFGEYSQGALHKQLAGELNAAGLRMFDAFPLLSSLDVNDLRVSPTSPGLTPYGTRVYAHILAAYLECSRLIPSAIIVKDRSGCSRPKRATKTPGAPKVATPPKAAKPAAPAKPAKNP